MGKAEIRGAPAKLWEVMKGGDDAQLVREILIHGPAGTGKSRGILEWLWWLATTFHGVRILIVRKTRVSLTESGLVTLEDQVIPAGHPVLVGPHRAHRQQYTIPTTKSEIVAGGMDNPTRLYSTDWDVVYFQEATEATEDEWERLRRGLRHFTIPVQVLVGDSNPDSPSHWLARRMRDGRTEDWVSRHWDNPKWYSRGLKDWTPEGKAYIESLSRLTGVRRRRLLKGEWVSAEGAVWENFDPAVHVMDRPKKLEDLGIRKYFGSMDWGFTAAGVLHIWGVDGENRIYLVEEHYRAGQPLQWWAQKVHEAYRRWQIMCVAADPARNDSISVANDFLAGLGCRRLIWPAYNRRRATSGGDMGGLDLVRHKFAPQADGRPAIYLLRGSLQGRDNALHEQGKPCSLAEEIPSYVYLQSDDGKPGKEATDPHCEDHGCFPGHVLVTDGSGVQRPIRTFRRGDSVLTPYGTRAVLDASPTGWDDPLVRVELAGGRVLTGTPSHEVWTTRGLKPLILLTPSDTVCVWPEQKWSSGEAGRGEGIQTPPIRLSPSTSAGTHAPAGGSSRTGFTGRSTPRFTVGSLAGCVSTTGTGTPGTTTRTTWNCSLRPPTQAGTEYWTVSEPELLFGIAALLESPGTANTPLTLDSGLGLGLGRSANAAGSRSRPSPDPGGPSIGSAPMRARRPTAEHLASMTRRASAPAGESFVPADTPSRWLVLARVLHVQGAGRAPVYNLTVEGEHTYFANGVLVGNCDSLRYAACFIWKRDLSEDQLSSKYAPGTFGQLLGHDEVA